eukprot:c21961_g1_i2.p1 GENE.c21961_g1_i2~~c21961_g1_i2.p1  ORF type:complete len:1367 (-),score=618.02 c21961_g1_i2:1228-5328(-)
MSNQQEGGSDEVQEIDMVSLLLYLKPVGVSALGIDQDLLEEGIQKNKSAIKSFISDAASYALVLSLEQEEGEEQGTGKVVVGLDPSLIPNYTCSVLFIKSSSTITKEQPLSIQIRFLALPGKGVINSFYNYVHQGFMPVLQFFSEDESDKGVSEIKKRMAALDSSLRMAQQSVEVPEVVLHVDEEIIKRAKKFKRKVTVDDYEDIINDVNFIGRLEKCLQTWTRDITRLLKLENESGIALASHEVGFWIEFGRVLSKIQEQSDNENIQLTIQLLRQSKRFAVIAAFEDTKFQAVLQRVESVNFIMKDFPIETLLSAPNIGEIRGALEAIFEKLNRVRQSQYSTTRALQFVEAIGRDVSGRMVSVLGAKKLMATEFLAYEKRHKEAMRIFAFWEDKTKAFVQTIQDLEKKREGKQASKKKDNRSAAELPLAERMKQIYTFRCSHHELKEVLGTVMQSSVITDIDNAYQKVAAVDVLDTSEGQNAWQTAIETYQEMTNRVEMQVANNLKDRLGAAKSAKEMFQVFHKFKALLKRDKIKAAVQEYQQELFGNVESDVHHLMEKFKTKYTESETHLMCRVRDMPLHAGNAIWARQIRGQLLAYTKRISDVMGDEWGKHPKGKKLWDTCDSFYRKLEELVGSNKAGDDIFNRIDGLDSTDIRPMKQEQPGIIFTTWEGITLKIFEKSFNMTEKMLTIVVHPSDQSLDLDTNFEVSLAEVLKEMRNFSFMGHKISNKIRKDVNSVTDLHSPAMQLREAISVYKSLMKKVSEEDSILFAEISGICHKYFKRLMTKTWREVLLEPTNDEQNNPARPDLSRALNSQEHPKKLIQKLHREVICMEEKVAEYISKQKSVEACLKRMREGSLSRENFAQPLELLQKIVDELDLHKFSNVSVWAKKLDEKVNEILQLRLVDILEGWKSSFKQAAANAGGGGGGGGAMTKRLKRRASVLEDGSGGEDIKIPVVTLQLRLHKLHGQQTRLTIEPSVEEGRKLLIAHLHQVLGIICALNRVSGSRMDKIVGGESIVNDMDKTKDTCRHLIKKLSTEKIRGIYDEISGLIVEVKAFVTQWLQLQSLWILDLSTLHEKCGETISNWCSILNSLRARKQSFRGEGTKKNFGVIIVEYGDVQHGIVEKLDWWMKEVQKALADIMKPKMNDFHSSVVESRTEFEKLRLDGSTSEAISTLQKMRELKGKRDKWSKELESMKEGQKLLNKGNHQFSGDWIDVENLEGNFDTLKEAIERKDVLLKEKMQTLQETVQEEGKKLDLQMEQILSEWSVKKPLSAPSATHAREVLSIFEQKCNTISNECKQLQQAKELLGLPSFYTDQLSSLREEMEDLKGVWNELAKVSDKLYELGQTPWNMLWPKKNKSFFR